MKKIIYYVNEVELIPNLSVDDFIKQFCLCHDITIEEINDRRTNYARGAYQNQRKLHISLCKFALYFFLYYRYSMKYREVSEIVCSENPVKRPTAFYYVNRAADFISISDSKFLNIFNNTISHLVQYADTCN